MSISRLNGGRSVSPMAFRDGSPRTPRSREMFIDSVKNTANEDSMWKRLREVGLDEETLKKKDKAALISYITKLESELYEYQHEMGLLIMQKKEWSSNYEQLKASADIAVEKHKLEHASFLRSTAEAEKRELSLRRALGIEKECVANLEKAVKEMRVESAQLKLESESKLVEARVLEENANKLCLSAESRVHAAEALEAEAKMARAAAERKLQEVEAREDELRRALLSSKSETDTKEEEFHDLRKSILEQENAVFEGQRRLIEGQTLLSQREKINQSRSEELKLLELELQAMKEKLHRDLDALNEEKATLNMKLVALDMREEAVIQREIQNEKKEQDSLMLQQRSADKEHSDIQRLTDEHRIKLASRKQEFEIELSEKQRIAEEELARKRHTVEQQEADLKQREEEMQEKEQNLELLLQDLAAKEKDLDERSQLLDARENSLKALEDKIEQERSTLHKERCELDKAKLEFDRSRELLESEREKALHAKNMLEISQHEREELLILETKLKEEIGNLRAQKLKIIVEADELKSQKLKFEMEWEQMDEKREQLRIEAEHVADQRKSLTEFVNDEKERLKAEKEELLDKLKCDSDALHIEREAYRNKMALEHSEWFSKIQREREDFSHDIEIQKMEMENNMKKQLLELENMLRERNESFEQEKVKELLSISTQRELAYKEMEDISLERRKLESERIEISLERERRDKEWLDIEKHIDELQFQKEKLKEQRELLHKDREDLQNQIQSLLKLEAFQRLSQGARDVAKGQSMAIASKWQTPITKPHDKILNLTDDSTVGSDKKMGKMLQLKETSAGVSSSTSFSWIKRCTDMIFGHSPERLAQRSSETDKGVRSSFVHQEKLGTSEIGHGGEDLVVSDSFAEYDGYLPLHEETIIGLSSGSELRADLVDSKKSEPFMTGLSMTALLKDPEAVLETTAGDKSLVVEEIAAPTTATYIHLDQSDNVGEDMQGNGNTVEERATDLLQGRKRRNKSAPQGSTTQLVDKEGKRRKGPSVASQRKTTDEVDESFISLPVNGLKDSNGAADVEQMGLHLGEEVVNINHGMGGSVGEEKFGAYGAPVPNHDDILG